MAQRNLQRMVMIGTLKANAITRISNGNEQQTEEAKHGGKIILPPHVLRKISLFIQTPMIFRLYNRRSKKEVLCGVLTFDANENEVCAPQWVLRQLDIKDGEKVTVNYLTSPLVTGTFAKFQPQSVLFHDITDPRAVLERCLRSYACLSRNDIIGVYYNQRTFELQVCETSPAYTISIVDCDLQVDFAAPPEMQNKEENLPEDVDLDHLQQVSNNDDEFTPFMGSGMRLDGKIIHQLDNKGNSEEKVTPQKHKLGAPDYDYHFGSLTFKRHKKDVTPCHVQEPKEAKIDSKSPQSPDHDQNDHEPSFYPRSRVRTRQITRRPLTRSQTAMFRFPDISPLNAERENNMEIGGSIIIEPQLQNVRSQRDRNRRIGTNRRSQRRNAQNEPSSGTNENGSPEEDTE